MNKQKLLEHLVSEINTMGLVCKKQDGCEISIEFKNKNLTHQKRGVMQICKFVDDESGFVRWGEYHKQLTKFERILLIGIVKANHHRIEFE